MVDQPLVEANFDDTLAELDQVVDDTRGDLAYDLYWYGRYETRTEGIIQLAPPLDDDFAYIEAQAYDPPDGTWVPGTPARGYSTVAARYDSAAPPTSQVAVPVEVLDLNTRDGGSYLQWGCFTIWDDAPGGALAEWRFGPTFERPTVASTMIPADVWLTYRIEWDAQQVTATITTDTGAVLLSHTATITGPHLPISFAQAYGAHMTAGRVVLDDFAIGLVTVATVVRRFPRDDGAGAGSPRIHPPPRSRRVYGGHQ